jgi:hypothetical protein
VLAGLCPAGCSHTLCVQPAQIGFFLSSRQDVLRIRRVVLVELTADDSCPADMALATTEAVASAVQAKQLFHLDVVRRNDPMCRDLPLDRLEALTLQELATMRTALNCDAVLFGRINSFHAFPRAEVGLFLKLMNLKDGKLVWGVDHTWDAAQKDVAARIDCYFGQQVRGGYDPIGSELVLKSPRAFLKFVSFEVAETLPPRYLPAPGKVAAQSGRKPSPRTAQTP